MLYYLRVWYISTFFVGFIQPSFVASFQTLYFFLLDFIFISQMFTALRSCVSGWEHLDCLDEALALLLLFSGPLDEWLNLPVSVSSSV